MDRSSRGDHVSHLDAIPALAGAAALTTGMSLAQQRFDGNWSVEATPESGSRKTSHMRG